jgi:hypothetical protein
MGVGVLLEHESYSHPAENFKIRKISPIQTEFFDFYTTVALTSTPPAGDVVASRNCGICDTADFFYQD